MKRILKYIILYIKGFCMGVADVIPGVSGGTIALLLGIYEQLVDSIHSFDADFVRKILKGNIAAAFSQTGWKFLTALFLGILSAIFSLAHLLKWLLQYYPVYLNAFFFGLILVTVIVIVLKVRHGDFAKVAVGLLSAIAMYQLVGMVPLQTPETWWFLFISGMIAICAWILPGISGAFVLLLLGKYEFIITAVSERNFLVLIIVALGCVVGILSFVRLLRLILDRYYDLTLSALAGIVLGSLRKIWPWREVVETITTSSGKTIPVQEMNILPNGFSFEVLFVLLLCLAGIAVGLILDRFDHQEDHI